MVHHRRYHRNSVMLLLFEELIKDSIIALFQDAMLHYNQTIVTTAESSVISNYASYTRN